MSVLLSAPEAGTAALKLQLLLPGNLMFLRQASLSKLELACCRAAILLLSIMAC